MAVDGVTTDASGQPDYSRYRSTAYSTYKQEYCPKYQRRQSPCIKQPELSLSLGEMESVSNYKWDFKAYNGFKRSTAIKPVGELTRMSGVMETNTTSKDAFGPKPITQRVQRTREQYHPPDVKMDCSTSYCSDFYARTDICKLPPIKPQQRKDSAKPFLGTTESREQFKAYCGKDLMKPASYKPRSEYTKPIEPFDGTSSYKGEFTPRSTDRAAQFRPQGNITVEGEYFGGGPPSPPPPLVMKQQVPLSPIPTTHRNQQEWADYPTDFAEP